MTNKEVIDHVKQTLGLTDDRYDMEIKIAMTKTNTIPALIEEVKRRLDMK